MRVLDSPKPLLMQALDECYCTESVEAWPNLYRTQPTSSIETDWLTPPFVFLLEKGIRMTLTPHTHASTLQFATVATTTRNHRLPTAYRFPVSPTNTVITKPVYLSSLTNFASLNLVSFSASKNPEQLQERSGST